MTVDKSSKDSFLFQGTILAAASMIVRIIGLVYRIPLTSILGNEGNGIYSAAFEIYTMLLLISSYSLPLAMSKLISKSVALRQYNNAYKYFKCSLIFAISVGAIIGIFSFVCSDFLASDLMKTPKCSYSLRILAPTVFIVAVIGVFRGFFQGLGNVVPTAISQVFEQICNAIVSVVAARYMFDMGLKVLTKDGNLSTAYGSAGGVLGTCLGAFTALVFLLVFFYKFKPYFKKRMLREVEPYVDTTKNTYSALIMIIVPVILSTAVYNISGLLDQAIFNNYMYHSGVNEKTYDAMWGIFSGKYRLLTNVPVALASSLAAALIPSLTESINTKNYREAKSKINLAIRFTMILTIPCFVGFSVLGGPILDLLWNDKDPVAIHTLTYGSIAIVLFSLSTLTNGILQGIDKMRVPVINALISLTAHIGVFYFLLVVLDSKVFAIVYSNVFFALLMCLLNGFALKKYSGYKQEYIRTFVIPFISSGIMGGVVYLIERLLKGILGSSIACLFAIIVGVAVYGLLMVFLRGITKRELLKMPMGNKVYAILNKLHLM